jgi:hypothetical protein
MTGDAMCMTTAIADLKAVGRRILLPAAAGAASAGESGEPHDLLDRKLIGQKET